MKRRFLLLAVLLLPVLVTCKKENKTEPGPIEGYNPTPVQLSYPPWFPKMPLPEGNAPTVEGIALGRRLYYDPLLHPQGGMSCSSCHLQDRSFTISTTGTAVLAHINLGWSDAFLWDGAVEGSLEDIMLFEVKDFFGSDIGKLQNHPEYPDLFFAAFGQRTITAELCARALAQFARSMISANSRYDRYYPGQIQPTEAEVAGYEIFNSEKGDCFHCHTPPLFTDNLFHNIGLDSVFDSHNPGRYGVSGDKKDLGLFKTPTLRNVALTAPYMHDGRFQTLEEVIGHYDHGVKPSQTLDPIMTKAGKDKGLQLTAEDKANLLAFLMSLTDTSYTTNAALSAP